MSFEVIKYILFGTLLLRYECRISANFYMGPKPDSPHLGSQDFLKYIQLVGNQTLDAVTLKDIKEDVDSEKLKFTFLSDDYI